MLLEVYSKPSSKSIPACLNEILKLCLFKKKYCTKNQHCNAITKKEYGFHRCTIVHQRYSKKRIKSVGNTCDNPRRISNQNIIIQCFHLLLTILRFNFTNSSFNPLKLRCVLSALLIVFCVDKMAKHI